MKTPAINAQFKLELSQQELGVIQINGIHYNVRIIGPDKIADKDKADKLTTITQIAQNLIGTQTDIHRVDIQENEAKLYKEDLSKFETKQMTPAAGGGSTTTTNCSLLFQSIFPKSSLPVQQQASTPLSPPQSQAPQQQPATQSSQLQSRLPSVAAVRTPMGFVNRRYDCFLNATLKACLAVPAYRELFKQLPTTPSFSIPYLLHHITESYESSYNNATQQHVNQLRSRLTQQHNPSQQHDAHEFFTKLMQLIEAENQLSITAYEKYTTSVGDGEPTQMLTLEPPHGNSTTVQAMVDQTFTMSQADSGRKRHLELTAGASLRSFVLRLNRDCHQGSRASSGIKRKYKVTNPWDPITVTINGQPRQLIPRSIVCHIGDSLTSGHYVTYTRDAPGVIFRHDDNKVQHRTSRDLETEDDPYMIFYELRAPAASSGQSTDVDALD